MNIRFLHNFLILENREVFYTDFFLYFEYYNLKLFSKKGDFQLFANAHLLSS